MPKRDKRVVVEDRIVGRKGASTRMKQATRAVAETLFTSDEGPPPIERLDWLVDELDDFLAQAGTRAKLIYGSCLRAIDTLAPLAIGALPPFTRLSPEARFRALEKFEAGPLGLSVLGAKATLCILYYEHEGAAREIGYDASCLRATE